jgi:hypothetical protein
MMTINKDKRSTLNKILKVGEDVLMTHKCENQNPPLKSSTSLGGAMNCNQEFVTSTIRILTVDIKYEFVDTYASPASHVDHVESCCLCTSGQEFTSQAFPKPSYHNQMPRYHNQMPSWKKVKFKQ